MHYKKVQILYRPLKSFSHQTKLGIFLSLFCRFGNFSIKLKTISMHVFTAFSSGRHCGGPTRTELRTRCSRLLTISTAGQRTCFRTGDYPSLWREVASSIIYRSAFYMYRYHRLWNYTRAVTMWNCAKVETES